MGGKALKNITTRRFSKAEFEYIAAHLIPDIRKELGCKVDLVKSFTQKESHGDMDIMIEWDKDNPNDLEEKFLIIQNFITPDEIHRNSSVISMNFGELQVDFIFIPSNHYDTCWHFFAFNDLGGFMGKIARSMKLKYGQDGLKFVIYSDDKSRKLQTVNISNDPKEIIEFLGFDYYKFVRGFETKSDIFEYVSNSSFYRFATFDGTELNASQRSRDMGRPMYEDLLEYLKVNSVEDKTTHRPTLQETFERVEEIFGLNLWRIVESEKYWDSMKQRANNKFNGSSLIRAFDYEEGAKLGKDIAKFKSLWPNQFSYNTFILENNIDTILAKFEEEIIFKTITLDP